MNFSVLGGVIRKGVPVVKLDGDPNQTRLIHFRVMRGKDKAGLISRIWPTDFRFTNEDRPTCGRVTLKEMEKSEPYSGIVLKADDASFVYDPGWSLNKLFATSQEEFERIFFQTRHRPTDPETQFFATRQLLQHYTENESHRCVAAVIMGYRAIDLGDPDMVVQAIKALKSQLARAPDLPVSWRPRLDGVHLTASMRSTLWQLHLFAGDDEAFVKELNALVEFLRRVESPLSTIVINGCPALLLYAHLCLVQGRAEEAVETAYYNADFYVAGLQRLKRVHKLFKEMLPPHNLVIASLALAERVKKDGTGPGPVEIIDVCHRIDRRQQSAKVISANYERLCLELAEHAS